MAMKFLVRFCLSLTLAIAAATVAHAIPILVLAETNRLLRFETTTPLLVQSQVLVKGLPAGEKLLAIDFRPSNGQLYGVTNASRLYQINPISGTATQVGSGSFSPALDFTADVGFDFNPVVDRIRIVTDKGQNLRVHPDSGDVVAVDTPVAFSAGDPNFGRTPVVAAAAYSNNVPGASSTTLYTVAMGQAQNPNVPTVLATQGSLGGSISPNSGQLFTVGNMGFLFVEPVGLDIGQNAVCYALMNGTDTKNELYTVDLVTGAVTRIAIIGGSADEMRDLAVIPVNSVSPNGAFQFNASNYNVNEADGSVTLSVVRSGDTTVPATVDFVSTDGTTNQRSDYIIAAGRLQFEPGETSKTIRILIEDDVYTEPSESFTVNLFNASGGFLPASPNPATVTIQDNDPAAPATNPIDGTQFFVRQQYFDFLNRPPDPGGLDYWSGQINSCGSDTICINRRRTAVSAAFFFSPEFQETGYFVLRVFQTGYGRRLSYAEFTRERNRVVAGSNLEQSRTTFVQDFVTTPEFLGRHPESDSPAKYVDDLNLAAGAPLTPAERDALVAGLMNGTQTRATVLQTIVDNPTARRLFFNRAFVTMQYFGYLRRDADLGGSAFWVNILDLTENFDSMVCAFITSAEYQQRFSSVVNHSNADCGQ
jgi:hypothetical protein